MRMEALQRRATQLEAENHRLRDVIADLRAECEQLRQALKQACGRC